MKTVLMRAGDEQVRYCFICTEQGEDRLPDEEFRILSGFTDRRDWAIAAVCVNDPEDELSPWEGPAVFGGRAFGSGARGTLDIIEKEVIPELDRSLGSPAYIIEGYSFAGLFALWAAYNSGSFSAACGVSPSVWFPGWNEYADEHKPGCGFMYLSIGKSEKKTRNRLMKTVEEDVIRQYTRAKAALGEDSCVFEFNEGNHFADVPLRRAKALNAFLQTLCKK